MRQQDTAAKHVGIWERKENGNASHIFVRSSTYREEWRHWADVDCIPAKGARKRFVWLGESAARGYFFDPLCTPARMLESLCNAVLTERQVEVIDLARVDLNLNELFPLLASISLLEPDGLIFFAGNNWDNVELRPEHFSALAIALREGGYPRLQEVFQRDIQLPACTSALQKLAEVAAQLSIPVIVLVPAFNLLEWRNEPAMQVPYLRGEGNMRWYNAREQAEAALAAGAYVDAIEIATEMVRYDKGTSSVSFSLLAMALLKMGRIGEARTMFERARDASCGLLLSHSPRCPTAVQELLRRDAAAHGYALVDLPRLFEQHLSGELPDRRLFFDYCHMTLEGLTVTIAAVANQLFSLLKQKQHPLQMLLAIVDSGLTPEDEARAHFLAAIHNAHYGQPDEVVAYHCHRSLALSPACSADMLCYLDFQLRSSPHWLCESYTQMCSSLAVRRYLSANDGRRTDKLADFSLYQAILTALAHNGIEAREAFVKLLQAEYLGRVRTVGQDLLAYRHRARTFRERTGYSLGQGRAYVQAYAKRSLFYLVSAAPSSLSCQLTCRLPGKRADLLARERRNRAGSELHGQLEVSVNGRSVVTLDITGEWQTYTFSLLEAALCEGENRLELLWPWPAFSGDVALEQDSGRLERGSFPEVLPVFGEIHVFTAC